MKSWRETNLLKWMLVAISALSAPKRDLHNAVSQHMYHQMDTFPSVRIVKFVFEKKKRFD